METAINITGRIERLKTLANLLDSQFNLFGFRFGLDSIIGLAPVIGDIISVILSGYIIVEAARMGAPERIIRKMIFNTTVDFFGGTIPILGDIFDFAWKANRRNIALIERHFLNR